MTSKSAQALLPIIACLSGCLTEEPPEIEVDLSNALALIGRGQDPRNTTILKYTEDGELLHAITRVGGGRLPWPSTQKLENGRSYLNFETFVRVGEETCTTVEVTTRDRLRCIDSKWYPAGGSPPWNVLPSQEAEREQVLWTNADGDVFYVAILEMSDDDRFPSLTDRIAVRRASGDIELISPAGFEFQRVVRNEAGEFFGIHCTRSPEEGEESYVFYTQCRIERDEIVDLSGEGFPTSDGTVGMISGDRLVVVTEQPAREILVGPLGSPITPENFSTDLLANPVDDSTDIGSLYLETGRSFFAMGAPFFELDGGNEIWARGPESSLIRLSPSIRTVEIEGKNGTVNDSEVGSAFGAILAMDTRPGKPILVAGDGSASYDIWEEVAQGTYLAREIDPASGAQQPIEIPENLRVHTLRYIDDQTALIGGRLFGEGRDEASIVLYKYDVDTNVLTELVQVSKGYEVVVP